MPPVLIGFAEDLRAVNERLVISSIRELGVLEDSEREKAQLNTLFAMLNEGILVSDGSGRIVMLNDAARRILRVEYGADLLLSATEVDALDIRRTDRSDLPNEARPLARALRGDVFVDEQVLLVHPDGTTHHLLTSGTSTKDSGGITLAILVFRDITERAALEARLVQTERLAALGTLSAGMAHEINNPLAIVVSNIDYALESVPIAQDLLRAHGGNQAEEIVARLTEVMVALGEAHEASARVSRIIQDIKTFGRIEVAERSSLDLSEVIDSAIRLTDNFVRQHATLRMERQWTPFVTANALQLGQVFTNLLVNAAQAVGEGSADTKEIVVSLFTDVRGSAVVEIKDCGPGVSPDIAGRIFDPFFTTRSAGRGSGLGLSICHAIVTSFDGEISLTSKIGEGATIRVILPAASQPVSTTIPIARHTATRRGRVLIVDDEPAIGRAITRVLQNDHDVVAHMDPLEAMRQLATDDAFDIVLCDLTMPGMSGIEFFEKVKASNPALAERIVFVTGGACTSEAQEFLRTTQTATLSKPLDTDALRRIVLEYSSGSFAR